MTTHVIPVGAPSRTTGVRGSKRPSFSAPFCLRGSVVLLNAGFRKNLTDYVRAEWEGSAPWAPMGAAPSSDEAGRLLLPDVLEQFREGHAKTSRELGGGLHGRIPKPCLDGSDVRPVQVGFLGQPLLSPGLALSELSDAGAKRQQQAVASLRHASDCRGVIGVSMDDQ
jgi:hypothetical protein